MAFIVNFVTGVAVDLASDIAQGVSSVDSKVTAAVHRAENSVREFVGKPQPIVELNGSDFVLLLRSVSEAELETSNQFKSTNLPVLQAGSFADLDRSTVVLAASPQAEILKQRPTNYEIYQALAKDPRVDMYEFLKDKNTKAIDSTPIAPSTSLELSPKQTAESQSPKLLLTPEGQAVVDGLKTAAGKVAAKVDSILSNMRDQ